MKEKFKNLALIACIAFLASLSGCIAASRYSHWQNEKYIQLMDQTKLVVNQICCDPVLDSGKYEEILAKFENYDATISIEVPYVKADENGDPRTYFSEYSGDALEERLRSGYINLDNSCFKIELKKRATKKTILCLESTIYRK